MQQASQNIKVNGTKLGAGFWLGAVPDLIMNVRNGDGYIAGAGKAALTGLAYELMPGVMWGTLALDGAAAITKGGMKLYHDRKSAWNMAHATGSLGGGYKDTQQAYTMRQAAVSAIQGSRMNARSALGGEARLMHR